MATIIGNSGDNVLSGTSDADTILGLGGADDIDAGGGNDLILVGSGGNDLVDGGSGTDTLVLGGNFADYVISNFGPSGVDFTGGGETTTATSVEVVVFNDAVVRVVGAGGEYPTIQSAIDAASDGEIILIPPGTYEENINVNKSVTLMGSGAPGDVIIEGSFRSDNGLTPSDSVRDFLLNNGYSGAAGAGVTVSADGVTISNITISGFNVGIELQSNDGLTLNGVDIDSSVYGIAKQDGTADVTNFTMNGGNFSDSYMGMLIYAASVNNGSFDNVTIDGTAFTQLGEKGIYAESLSNALITNITMNDVGEYGRGVGFDVAPNLGEFGNGIDINLKYGVYSNIEISNFAFTDVGSSAGVDGQPLDFGGAIVIKARDDASSYNSNPASLTGVTIENGTIDGTSTGIRIGEPGKVNLGPHDVVVNNVEVTNELVSDYNNYTADTLDINGTADADTISGGTDSTGSLDIDGAAGDDIISGGGGADTLAGGEGNDTIGGGAGKDNASYASDIGGYTISVNGSTVTVTDTDAGNGDDGTDTLQGVEDIEFGDASALVVGAGGAYATIQSAIDAASDGDVIVVLDGTYNENLNINKAVSIIGSGAGVAGDDISRDAINGIGEVSVNGAHTVSAGGAVTIDGLRFVNSVTGGNTVTVTSGHDHQILNSIFYSSVQGGSNADRAILLQPMATGSILIEGNYLTGAFTGAFSTASWDRGIWTDGGGVTVNIQNNTLQYVRTGVNADASSASAVNITGNLFSTAGSGVSVGVDHSNVSIIDNDFFATGTDFNYRNITADVTLDASAAVNSVIPSDINNDLVVILGGSGNDTLTGTAGSDYIDANNHPTLGATADSDTLSGGGGDDVLFGRAGNDVLDGGEGADAMDGGAGDDTYAVDDAGDTVTDSSGIDTVETTLGTYSINGTSIENLTYTGLASFNGTGNAGDNIITGGSGDDVLDGKLGADTLIGGAGNDAYFIRTATVTVTELADEGTDRVQSGNRSLDLNDFANIEQARLLGATNLNLTGDAGANRLTGNAGDNIITGGLGVDNLSGGLGNDVFTYQSALDSGAGLAARDRINDFVQGEDLINLLSIDAKINAVGNNAFVWIDTDTFSGGGVEGELRYRQLGASTLIQGDTDGDGVADFEILIGGIVALNDGDFIL